MSVPRPTLPTAPETPVRETVNILIIDDRPDKALALEAAISQLGENVVRAHSGAEGLRALLKQEFAVILLDVKMPGMDGFETAALIRKRPKSELTPIIFVSAVNDQENHISRGYSMGAVDYILAPVEPEILRAKVSVFVDLFRMTEQIRRQGEERAQRIRAEAARAEAETARERSTFLAEATGILASSLEIPVICSALARLTVPRLADCCLVDLFTDGGSAEPMAVAHYDPAAEAHFHAYQEKYASVMGYHAGQGTSVRNGGTETCLTFDEAAARKFAASEDQLQDLRRLKIGAYQSVPLRARNRVFGALNLIKCGDNQFRETDFGLARDLAVRAGLTLENAMLYSDAMAARREAERANQSKDRFLAMLSHELRTPLTPVLAAISLLEREESYPEEIRESLRMIQRNVALEARLIDDLLDLTRISKGKLQLHFEEVDAHELLCNALHICEAEVELKQLKVALELGASRHYLFADSARVQQVFWNLLKNAVKFSDAGGTISVRTFDDHLENTFHVEVTDHGEGIGGKFLPRIFDAFEQGANPRKGGLGLGLAISHALVELHKGGIRAYSEGLGRGARFDVSFPAHSDELLAGAATDQQVELPPERIPARLLIVEDHLDTLTVMARLLRRIGYSVLSASSVSEALKIASDSQFDILISDMGLPDGTGIDLLAALQKNAPQTIGVALSGFGMEEDLRRTKIAGFKEHLTKPVDIAKLDEVLQHLAHLPSPANISSAGIAHHPEQSPISPDNPAATVA